MFYYRDFNCKSFDNTRVEINSELRNKIFTVILENNKKLKTELDKYSIINSVRPLAYLTSIVGIQILTYENNTVHKVKLHSKFYTLLVITLFVLVHVFVSPRSWRDTKSDVPLNILTRCFGYISTTEVIYLIFISTVGNSEHYLRLMKKFDDFDQHFMTSKTFFVKGRMVAISLIFISILIISNALWPKFHINNIGAYFTLYLFILQGIVFVFFLSNIHSRVCLFNDLLLSRLSKTLPAWKCKTLIFEDSFANKLVKKILTDSEILGQKLRSHYHWFELMQMYDKTADCIYLFNKIYAGQVFLMFQSSFFCTLLIICRYLSPSLKNSTYCIESDLYVYLCINVRPVYLAKMCDVISDQKNKTLLMLMKILVHSELDDMYRSQLQTMISLVSTRRMEITCNVFTVDLQTTMNFSGRVISYTVLMIQYFYMHVFSE